MNSFYKDLKAGQDFFNVFDRQNWHQVPSDWLMILTDVVNSTEAIEEGRYKDVNICGGLASIAVANELSSLEYPFVFGGDGVTMLIPPVDMMRIRSILRDVQKQASDLFKLKLRVAVIPVSEIGQLEAGKIRISQYYDQAMIRGDVDFAESVLKGPLSRYHIHENEPGDVPADFSGFTCRWKDIPGKGGVTAGIIVRFLNQISAERLMREFHSVLVSAYGNESSFHPLSADSIELSDGRDGAKSNQDYLDNEKKLIRNTKSGISKYFHLFRVGLERKLMRFAMATGLPLKSGWYDLSKLKNYQVLSSDFKKFDGSLKMTLSGTDAQLDELEQWLQKKEAEGELLFGIHRSDRAILTCIMHTGSEREVHFVDSADGGYAMAAKILKNKM